MREIVSPLDGFGSPFGTRRRALAPFSPAILFADGEQGAWFDDDPETKFTDPADTTLAGLTQSVALELEKSRGLELGPELVVNGTFDVDLTGWSLSRGASSNTIAWQSGVLRSTPNVGASGAATYVSQQIPNLTVGALYKVQASVRRAGLSSVGNVRFTSSSSSINTTDVTIHVDVAAGVSDWVSGSGYFIATSTTMFVGVFYGAFEGEWVELDDVSVKELPGNHARQDTTTFRPTRQTDGILYDGSDDRQTTPYRPTLAGSIIARFNGATASRVVLGSQAATDGRAFLGLDASGRMAAGIGAQGTATIFAGADLRNAFHTGAVTWDGTTVKLYLDGAEVYSAAQSGAVNTTVDMFKGALNANGTAAGFWQGRIEHAIAIDRVLTPAEITNITNFWSA